MSITTGWRLLWLLFLLLVCALVGRFSYIERLNTLKRPFEIRQNALTEEVALLFTARLSLVETQIRLFKHQLELLNPDHNELQSTMYSMFSVYQDLLQVRWISPSGAELVRIDKNTNNQIVIGSASDLQNKSNRYYFQAAQSLRDDEIFISQIDLNVERGRVQRPIQPTLRAAIKATLPKLGSGFVVINFDLHPLLFDISSINIVDNELLVGAGKERWIVHPDPNKEWRVDLGLENQNIASDLPSLFALFNTEATLQAIELDEQIYNAFKLTSQTKTQGGLQNIYIINRTPSELLPSLKRSALFFALVFAVTMALAGLAVLLIYSQQLNRLNSLGNTLQKEKVNLQQALERQSALIDELAEAKKLSSLSVMVAGLAHELNTPIGATQLAISSQSDALKQLISDKQNGLTKSAFENYLSDSQLTLNQARQNNERAIELIQGFKRLTFERANDELAEFNVADCLTDLHLSMKGLLLRHRIRLTLTIPPQITLTGYAGAFSQIVQIIIANATEHAFSNKAGARIEVSCETTASFVVVKVSDNGDGIKDEDLPHIFEPFYTTKRYKQHTGLGLHMAKVWIAKAFNGDISVSSQSQLGTTFTLRFGQLDKLAEVIRSDKLSTP